VYEIEISARQQLNNYWRGALQLNRRLLASAASKLSATLRSNDPNVAMPLMRDTSLATTTKYMRVVEERMRDAVENLGGGFGGDKRSVQCSISRGAEHNRSQPDFQ
jgi:hypothetical protein